MLKTFTVSAVLAVLLVTSTSTAFAAPRHGQTPAHPTTTGAEWWQDRGNADDMGSVYRYR